MTLINSLGTAEIAIIAAILLAPFAFIVYCVVDILRTAFKRPPIKWLFLLLVIFAPFVGSVIYLILRKDYVKPKPFHNHFG